MSTPVFRSFVDAIRSHATGGKADEIACRFLNDDSSVTEWTYQELDDNARRIAALLIDSGCAGRSALLLFLPDLEFVAAFFGCMYAGVTPVPAYPPDPSMKTEAIRRLNAIASDCDAAAAVSSSTVDGLLQLGGVSLAESLPGYPLVLTDSDGERGSLLDDVVLPEGDSVAFLQYTSGSTGDPKGVMVTHQSLVANTAAISAGMGHTDGLSMVGWLPLFHDMGLIGHLMQPLWHGGTSTLMPPHMFLRRPAAWLEAISKYQAHTAGAPNFGYELCAKRVTDAELAGLDLSCWKVAFNGAEPIRAETIDRFIDRFRDAGFAPEAMYPCYGLAEATLFVSGGPLGEPVAELSLDRKHLKRNRAVEASSEDQQAVRVVSCGPMWLDDVRIVDPDECLEMPGEAGFVGEIWIRDPSVAAGYWAQDGSVAEEFAAKLPDVEGSYLRTGDLGLIHEGDLYVTGRIKDLVIIRGKNHYPADLEETAESASALVRPGCVAAFSVSEGEGEVLHLAAEVRDGVDPAQLDAVASDISSAISLSAGVSVAKVSFLAARTLPKTSSGKIRRHRCAEMLSDGSLETVLVTSPTAPAESEIATPDEVAEQPLTMSLQTWIADELGMEPSEVDPTERLASLGVDSLSAQELAEWVQQEESVSIDHIDLTETATIAQLVDWIEAKRP